MVRTKADNTARKAVAAKAPRKAFSSSSSSSSSALSSPKASKYAGGNVACARPVPDWQKGVSNFFTNSPRRKLCDKENDGPDDVEIGESSGAGCSSQGSSSGTSNSSQGETTVVTADD